jgi:uncharacterized protein
MNDATSTTATTSDPQVEANLALIARFYECYASGDLDAMRSEVLASDVVWVIPGHHPLAGPKRGADEIVAYFAQLAKADFRADPITLAANHEYVIDLHRGWGTHGDATLDITWVLAYQIVEGRIAHVQNFAADQHAADLFFWTVWGDQLRPVPDRLLSA